MILTSEKNNQILQDCVRRYDEDVNKMFTELF